MVERVRRVELLATHIMELALEIETEIIILIVQQQNLDPIEMKKRQRWKIGSVVKVPMDHGFWNYAILHNSPDVSFFNLYTNQELPVEDIQKADIMFNVGVSEYIIKKGIWPIVGCIDPVGSFVNEEPMRFIQDSISGEVFLYHSRFADQGYMKSCGIKDIEGLEKAAAWDEDHIKDRLQAHFKSSVDRWADTMKVDKKAYNNFVRRKQVP